MLSTVFVLAGIPLILLSVIIQVCIEEYISNFRAHGLRGYPVFADNL